MQKNKKQKISLPKKEGVFGWMSYIGCPFTVFGLMVILNILKSHAHGSSGLEFLILMGLALTIPVMLKSKYHISLSSKTILSLLFIVATIIFELFIYAPEDSGGLSQGVHCLCELSATSKNRLWFIGWFCFFSFLWYLRYFYKKAKDGYRYVWLKVILFFLVLSILFLFILISTN
ncbi:MAG: hypothetical protein E7021_02270 [Alphaproteobacteria bacterium]|nr:hypothetical protein [Alphaproteobacteria bacterium]